MHFVHEYSYLYGAGGAEVLVCWELGKGMVQEAGCRGADFWCGDHPYECSCKSKVVGRSTVVLYEYSVLRLGLYSWEQFLAQYLPVTRMDRDESYSRVLAHTV